MKHSSIQHPSAVEASMLKRQRATLSTEQAVQIYELRMSGTWRDDPECMMNANVVAAKFKVSAKAVRDIWNRRTWADDTHHLWREGEKPVFRSQRRVIKYLSNCSSSYSSQRFEDKNIKEFLMSSKPKCTSNIMVEVKDSRGCFPSSPFEANACSEWTWECGIPPLKSLRDDPFLVE
mmetsp:Transcript_22245/g.60782  ORF Transcript_22245/g.60782 Transcript_22245/m.60782 type:complete len:177 (+) Transcript_22245:70-600(+)